MNRQIIFRSNRTMSMALLLLLVVGCTGPAIAPTLPPAPTLTAEASAPIPDTASSPTSPGVESTATSQPSTDENVLYQDDFKSPTTGWAVAEFDNYFIGYHEPESYHIEIKSPNSKAPVVGIPEPEKYNYPDATIELQVQTVSGRTATEGDFRYGLVFRRSGDNYY
ncbi:MAG TPA: hypothetical protein VI524_09950, partial [Anaerolineales bacterium]|nr:hypothetical protein [Anaerolineales bacterium]